MECTICVVVRVCHCVFIMYAVVGSFASDPIVGLYHPPQMNRKWSLHHTNV